MRDRNPDEWGCSRVHMDKTGAEEREKFGGADDICGMCPGRIDMALVAPVARHGRGDLEFISSASYRLQNQSCLAVRSNSSALKFSSNSSACSRRRSVVLGGRRPSSAFWSQILSWRRAHLSLRSCMAAWSFGLHLLFKMRRMASGETLKCSDRDSVEYFSGSWACRPRIPSTASGDNFLRGFQPVSNFLVKAFFCTCHDSGFLDRNNARFSFDIQRPLSSGVVLVAARTLWLPDRSHALSPCLPSDRCLGLRSLSPLLPLSFHFGPEDLALAVTGLRISIDGPPDML